MGERERASEGARQTASEGGARQTASEGARQTASEGGARQTEGEEREREERGSSLCSLCEESKRGPAMRNC